MFQLWLSFSVVALFVLLVLVVLVVVGVVVVELDLELLLYQLAIQLDWAVLAEIVDVFHWVVTVYVQFEFLVTE